MTGLFIVILDMPMKQLDISTQKQRARKEHNENSEQV